MPCQKEGSKSDQVDARKLAELLRTGMLRPVYHGENGLRTLRELARSYQTISKDLTRVMNRLKALYRGWGIPCAGTQVYAPALSGAMVEQDSASRGAPPRGAALSTAGWIAGLAAKPATNVDTVGEISHDVSSELRKGEGACWGWKDTAPIVAEPLEIDRAGNGNILQMTSR
jgi:hypothetical protein